MPQICVSFFLSTSRAVCYGVMDWKKGLELVNEEALKRLEFFGLGRRNPGIKGQIMELENACIIVVMQQVLQRVGVG